MSERRIADAWKEIVEEILPRACARQARECGRAIALGKRAGLSTDAIGIVIDDGAREYEGLVMAQQKLAELLAGGQLAPAGQHDTSAIRDAMRALNPRP
jgi:hypothetical protein